MNTLAEGTVLMEEERTVYHVDSGLTTKTLMAVISFQQPVQRFVLMRETLTPNVADATVSYMEIPGTTFEECMQNMEKMSQNILSPAKAHRINGRVMSWSV